MPWRRALCSRRRQQILVLSVSVVFCIRIYFQFCLSICLCVCVSVCLCVCQTDCHCLSLSAGLSCLLHSLPAILGSELLFIGLQWFFLFCLSVCLSVCRSVCLSVCLSFLFIAFSSGNPWIGVVVFEPSVFFPFFLSVLLSVCMYEVNPAFVWSVHRFSSFKFLYLYLFIYVAWSYMSWTQKAI